MTLHTSMTPAVPGLTLSSPETSNAADAFAPRIGANSDKLASLPSLQHRVDLPFYRGLARQPQSFLRLCNMQVPSSSRPAASI